MNINIPIQVLNNNMDIITGSNNAGKIEGAVRKQGFNFPCAVRLYERLTGRLIAQVQTDSDGFYKFLNLALGAEFAVIAHDHQRQYNAVIQDMVVPK